MSATQQAKELRLQCAAQSQDATIARLRGALERARGVLVKTQGVLEAAAFALNEEHAWVTIKQEVEHGEALGQVRTALREIDAALKESHETD